MKNKTPNTNIICLKTDYSRRFPDPLNLLTDAGPYNIEHFVLLCKASDIPAGISKKPNPRQQRIDYGIYKEIRGSLENYEDPTFHLKNKGITLLAHKVKMSEDKKTAIVYLGEGDGIADGAHTYEIILATQRSKTCPENQYIRFEIITGISRDMGIDITEGLNTAVQVEAASLDNLRERFEWIKDTIKDMPYADKIAYMQNENKDYDIRDIISFLTLFNIKHFSSSNHPKMAYVSKAKCLLLYEENQESYEMLRPILKDILYLSDYVHVKGRERYNAEIGGSAGAMKGVFTTRKRGMHKLIFMPSEIKSKLFSSSLLPILGALRILVEKKNNDKCYSWRLESFDKVLEFFDEIAPKMITTTYKTSLIYGRKPNPIGKDDNHWDNLYKTAALHYLEKHQMGS